MFLAIVCASDSAFWVDIVVSTGAKQGSRTVSGQEEIDETLKESLKEGQERREKFTL